MLTSDDDPKLAEKVEEFRKLQLEIVSVWYFNNHNNYI